MFNNSKYSIWYFNIINKARSQQRFKNSETYYENHHIVPKSLGGDNSKMNLILLTAREHYVVHLLLPKMCCDNLSKKKMTYAFINLSTLKNRSHKRYSSRLYARHKKIFIQNISGKNCYLFGKSIFTGEKNGMFGKSHKPESIQKMRDNRRNYSGEQNPAFGKSRHDLAERNAAMKGKKCWINKDNISKSIFKEEVDSYLLLGWKSGRFIPKGKRFKRAAPTYNKTDIKLIEKVRSMADSKRIDIMAATGLSRATVYRILNQP